MDVLELAEEFTEDSEGQIVAVQLADDGLLVDLEMDCWNVPGVRRRFRFHAIGLEEAKARPGWCGQMEWLDDHPLTWNHNFPWLSIYYSSAPQHPAEVIGTLFETHERIFQGWRPLTDYLNASCTGMLRGNGLLANGPKPLVDEYVLAVQKLLRTYTHMEDRKRRPSKVLVLGESFVICSNVRLDEIPVESN